ncbi:hypothetical protein [Oceanicaulis sp.]|uniref:hypothetical protein n=1 Tax=Oceanicaulis sp. TaxID=1924941 RepID=UPI003F72CDA6
MTHTTNHELAPDNSERLRQVRLPRVFEDCVTPCDRVAFLLGGVSLAAEAIGCSRAAFYIWRTPVENGGQSGRFPEVWLPRVRRAMKARFRDLPDGFLTKTGKGFVRAEVLEAC